MSRPERVPRSDLRRVPFDETYLERSFDWLADADLARLIAAPRITREDQRVWFEGLGQRTDYAVWGIEYEGEPVGVMGLRFIGFLGGAEYFIYLGERRMWGRGIAAWAFGEIYEEARLRRLPFFLGIVLKSNERSRAVHQRLGMEPVTADDGQTVLAVKVKENWPLTVGPDPS